MATGSGSGPTDLSHFDRLSNSPEEHHVFQALRIIEAQYSENPRLGESRRAREDRVRLGQEAELAFPPSTIAAFTPGAAGKPDKLINRFFGLFGPQGPLPLHLTEYARDRLRNHRDPTLVAFADTLTHRMLSLFYRAWAMGQPAPSFDRGEDPVAQRVAALAGYKGKSHTNRDAMPDVSKYHFAGHLGRGARNPEGLVSMLQSYFGAHVSLQQFVGSWLRLEPDDQWQMGRFAQLGRTTSIGTRVWSRAAKFRLRIGPLKLDEYERFLPGNASLDRLRDIVRNYIGDTLDWDVQLVLKGREVPRAVLGGTTRLGHTSWIGSGQSERDTRPDAEDLFLNPVAAQHQGHQGGLGS